MPIGLVLVSVVLGLIAYLLFDGRKGLTPDQAKGMCWIAFFVCMMVVGGILIYAAK